MCRQKPQIVPPQACLEGPVREPEDPAPRPQPSPTTADAAEFGLRAAQVIADLRYVAAEAVALLTARTARLDTHAGREAECRAGLLTQIESLRDRDAAP